MRIMTGSTGLSATGNIWTGKLPNFYASTSLRAGQAIQESVPGIENITILYKGFKGDIKSGDKTVPLSGHWANESFFKVFTFPMISGDPSTALKEPYSIVLTETSAKKLFGRTDVLGKSVILPGNATGLPACFALWQYLL